MRMSLAYAYLMKEMRDVTLILSSSSPALGERPEEFHRHAPTLRRHRYDMSLGVVRCEYTIKHAIRFVTNVFCSCGWE